MKKLNIPSSQGLRGSTPAFDEDDAGQNKQFWIIIGAFAAFLSLVGGILLWSLNRHEEKKDLGYQLSQGDKDSINAQAKKFIEASGTWGLKNDQINDKNVMDVWYLVRLKSPNNEMFYTDRQTQYKSLGDDIMAPGGNISYSGNAVDGWDDDTARSNMMSFKVQGFQVSKMPDRGDSESSEGKIIATVPVSFQSVENSVIPTGTDSAWDGKFKQMQKTFQNTGTLTMVKDKGGNGAWRVRDVQEVNNPFVLVTWDTPNRDYISSQLDMRQIKTYQGTFAKDYYGGPTATTEGPIGD